MDVGGQVFQKCHQWNESSLIKNTEISRALSHELIRNSSHLLESQGLEIIFQKPAH